MTEIDVLRAMIRRKNQKIQKS